MFSNTPYQNIQLLIKYYFILQQNSTKKSFSKFFKKHPRYKKKLPWLIIFWNEIDVTSGISNQVQFLILFFCWILLLICLSVQLRDHQDWIIEACNLEAHREISEFSTEKSPQTSNRGITSAGSNRPGNSGSGSNQPIADQIYVPDPVTSECEDNNIELWSFGDGGNCTEITVTSPNYPNWYPANAQCNYNINAPENTKVHIFFVMFA